MNILLLRKIVQINFIECNKWIIKVLQNVRLYISGWVFIYSLVCYHAIVIQKELIKEKLENVRLYIFGWLFIYSRVYYHAIIIQKELKKENKIDTIRNLWVFCFKFMSVLL